MTPEVGSTEAKTAAAELTRAGPKPEGAQRLGMSVAHGVTTAAGSAIHGRAGNFLLTFWPAWPRRLSPMSMIATTLMSLEAALPRIGRLARWSLAGSVAAARRELWS
jgi:hypothetical protein